MKEACSRQPPAHGHVTMDLDAHYASPRWPENRVRGELTDKKINRYLAQGFYSPEFREARRELWEKRKKRRDSRDGRTGNFVHIEGRLVYSPT